MKELLALLCNRLEQGRPTALASVLAQQGSAPRGAGARLIADAGGLVAGTVGGGLLEAQTLEACRAALREGQSRLLDFTLGGEFFTQGDMICGGTLQVLIEVLLPPADHAPFFRAVLDSLSQDGAVLITDITDPAHPLRTACMGKTRIGAPLPDKILEMLSAACAPDREAHTLAHEGRNYFLECCLPLPRMIIAGGGHVSLALAQTAAAVGFETTVLDDRPEFAQPERFPWATQVSVVPDYQNCFAGCAPDARSYIVIVTRGHRYDAAVLSQALSTQAGYIGMIGSRRKRDEVYAVLRTQGISEEALAKVFCPVGLDIGAETPEEIAISIVAECIAHRRRACSPENMRH